MTSTAILIPARYGSTRFPGKPLCDLGGLPMIVRVYEQCVKSGLPVFVLTDNLSINDHFDINTCIVDNNQYNNGTERCAGAVTKSILLERYDRFINVQGDMPDVTLEIINAVYRELNFFSVVTAYTDMDPALQSDPNVVKMIKGKQLAHWFGRGFNYGYHHLGVYGYRRYHLEQYYNWPPSKEENIEKLEQLRWYDHDVMIRAVKVNFSGIEINTPEDAEKWNDSWKSVGHN